VAAEEDWCILMLVYWSPQSACRPVIVDCFKCAYVIINGCRYSLASSSSLRPSDASPVDITWTSAAHTRLLDLIAGDPLVVG